MNAVSILHKEMISHRLNSARLLLPTDSQAYDSCFRAMGREFINTFRAELSAYDLNAWVFTTCYLLTTKSLDFLGHLVENIFLQLVSAFKRLVSGL